jgi:hypothetical protein
MRKIMTDHDEREAINTWAEPQKLEPVHQITWGIIRYAAGSGRVPEDDAACFDGWYSDRVDALMVANDWMNRFPRWIVALVQSDQIWFGDGDFSKVKGPLTTRERWRDDHNMGRTQR